MHNGTLPVKDYFNQLLRLIYRLIFLLTVEERGLLHPDGTSDAIKALYANGYGIRRLRERSVKRNAHDRFADLWDATKVVCRGLAAGEPRLGLPALAGIFAANQCPALDAAKLENRALLLAVFKLAWLREGGSLARVNWRDMGPEELGSVYESLLELVPQITGNGRQFAFAAGNQTKGNARKTTGSYYTPDSLVQVLLDSALEPVIADTIAKNPGNATEALLGLSIVDPACGSGHFLLAAARRLAAHVARLTANGTPSAAEYRHALRQVVGRCIFGVDLNPMAVELCKVGLWMEAIEPGLPLTFLNSHIQYGNALLGTTPELMEKGIPDAAWDAIEGDDKKIASGLKKRNKAEAGGQRTLDFSSSNETQAEAQAIARAITELDAASDADASLLAQKEERWDDILSSDDYRHQKLVADAWCAAFVWPKKLGESADAALTNAIWRRLRDDPTQTLLNTEKIAGELADQYSFFHWHLQFPQVFAKGGFDVVLGNPPWESLEVDENHTEVEQRCIRGAQASIANSGLYGLTGSGRKNLYALFIERGLTLRKSSGRAGVVVPTELVQAAETESLSRKIFACRVVSSLCDFQNRRDDGKKWFLSVHPQYRFSLLTLANGVEAARFAFNAQSPSDLDNPTLGYTQTVAEILAYCGHESFRVPMFIKSADARIMARAYTGAKILADLPTAEVASGLMFNFGKVEKQRKVNAAERNKEWDLLPVFEGENIHQFDHRFAVLGDSLNLCNPSNADKDSPALSASTCTYLPLAFVTTRVQKMSSETPPWSLVLRRQARANDSYICISAIVPVAAVEGSLTVFLGNKSRLLRLVAVFNSYLMNYVLGRRQSGPNVNKGMYGLLPIRFDSESPFPFGDENNLNQFIDSRVLELTYTAWDLELFARDVGYEGSPFRWNSERRFLLRCELDAAFFHLYRLSREDANYIMETFPIVRKNDEKAHGEYRTKRVILEIYDAITNAIQTGKPYRTPLDPLPAAPGASHGIFSPDGTPRDYAEALRMGLLFTLIRRSGDAGISQGSLSQALLWLEDAKHATTRLQGTALADFERIHASDPLLAQGSSNVPNLLQALENEKAITRDAKGTVRVRAGCTIPNWLPQTPTLAKLASVMRTGLEQAEAGVTVTTVVEHVPDRKEKRA